MSEAGRLLHAGTDQERALLRAGADEEPSRESILAASRALGLAPRVALFASLAALVARAVSSATKSSPVTTVATFVIAPVVLAGVVTAAVVAGRAAPHGVIRAVASPVTVQGFTAPPVTAVPSAPQPASPTSAENAVTASQAIAVPAVDALPAARVKKESAAPALRSSPDADLPEQVRLVDRARSLVAAGDASGALAAADAYDRRFPRGILAEEAALVRIQATEARGDRAEAASQARHFLAQYPESVHRNKVQWLLGDGTK